MQQAGNAENGSQPRSAFVRTHMSVSPAAQIPGQRGKGCGVRMPAELQLRPTQFWSPRRQRLDYGLNGPTFVAEAADPNGTLPIVVCTYFEKSSQCAETSDRRWDRRLSCSFHQCRPVPQTAVL